jgi:hypothetical protein
MSFFTTKAQRLEVSRKPIQYLVYPVYLAYPAYPAYLSISFHFYATSLLGDIAEKITSTKPSASNSFSPFSAVNKKNLPFGRSLFY